MNNKAFSHRLRQAGFTLVEILVALIIGMLVVLAAMASMLGTRSTAATGDDVNVLHQSSALAFRLLGQQIRQAGYFPIDATGPLYYFDVNAGTKLDSEPAFFAIKGQEAAAGSVNDTLKVGFAPNPDFFHDCLGQVAKDKDSGGAAYKPASPADPANVRLITSEFYVVNGALRCKGSGHTTPQPIIDGVERFDVMYGIGDAGTERVVRYVTATNVASFDQVRTVRVCLQLAGTSRSNPGGSYVDCDGSSRTSSDGRLRRVYTAVFALRNL
ncbi:PilW family protein [Variovorax paradoxus]|uniref:Type IV pilus assembly protein PilW n=1 Tax=Variovorax paradoxus TaxID=34073 RepID=A0AAW8EAQ3_VARPD|nr:PilW family protein [Variovorax paradoxus]MDP9969629.1 type IV pilus assembly protein PilW [Variovorax paradoxus]